MTQEQIFLLSPASCSGKRAQILLREAAGFDLAVRLRSETGATLGEVFSFLSGLYFRGKLAYAGRFSQPSQDLHGTWIITAGRGLVRSDCIVRRAALQAFA